MTAIINREDVLRGSELFGYKLATEADIEPGALLYMAGLHLDGRLERPEQIRLNDEPTDERDGTSYVFYRCPPWEGQCFVPRSKFVDVEIEEEACGPYRTTLYLMRFSG